MRCFIMFVTARTMVLLKELADALNIAYNNWDGRCIFLVKSFMIKSMTGLSQCTGTALNTFFFF